MKKIVVFLCLTMAILSSRSQTLNLTNQPALSGANVQAVDYMWIVDSSAITTYRSRRISIGELINALENLGISGGGGGGELSISGTPVANDIPRFTDGNTVEGLSYAELKAAMDLESGTDFDPAGTDNSTDVTLAGTPDYLTISGQIITRGLIDLSTDVTGSLPYASVSGTPSLATVATSGDYDDLINLPDLSSYLDITDTVSTLATLYDLSQIVAGGGGFTQEEIEDFSGAMFIGNTETLITATYQDADGTIDLVVDNDLANYSNATSGFLNASSIGSTVQAYDADLTTYAGITPSANVQTLLGAANYSAFRTSLGVDAAGTDNSTNVTLAGALDYLTITGQQITRNAIDLATDVTGTLANTSLDADLQIYAGITPSANVQTLLGAANYAAFRTSLDVDQAGTDNSTNVTLSGTPDYITISGQTITRGLVDLANDVTGSLPYASLSGAPSLATVATSGAYADLSGTPTLATVATSGDYDDLINKPVEVKYITIALSDMINEMTTGTSLIYYDIPHAATLTGVHLSVKTAPIGSAISLDILVEDVSILSTELTIDDGETKSSTAATAAVISDASISQWERLTFDVTQIGSATPGTGPILTLTVEL